MPKAEVKNEGLLDSWGRRNRKHGPRKCPECGKTFMPLRHSSRYCSRLCSWKNNGKNQRMVNESWWTDQKGYIVGWIKRGGKKVRKRYHRHLMECHLGYELPAHVIVHHLNGQRRDNRLENLAIVSWGTHNKLHAIAKVEGN